MRNLSKAEINSMHAMNNVVTWRGDRQPETHPLYGSTISAVIAYFLNHYAEHVPEGTMPTLTFEGVSYEARRESQTGFFLFGRPQWLFESLDSSMTVIAAPPKAKTLFMIA